MYLRRAVVVVSCLVFVTALLGASEQVAEPATYEAAWPMLGHDSQHSFTSPLRGPETPTLLWKRLPGHERHPRGHSPIIAADGTLYMWYDRTHFYALTPDGSQKWARTYDHCRGFARQMPAVAQDGTVYLVTGEGDLAALEPSSLERWRFTARKGSARGPELITAPVLGPDGTIFVGSHYGLYAIAANGREKWLFETGGSLSHAPAVAADGTIYIAQRGLTAVAPDGSEKWHLDMDHPWGVEPAIGPDGTIYVTAGDRDRLCAVSPAGEVKWELRSSRMLSPWLAVGPDGTVYCFAGELTGHLVALNPDGSRRWMHPLPQSAHAPPAIDADGVIYICDANYLFAIRPDGTEKWRLRTDGPSGAPVIGPDGRIYLLTYSGLIAVGEKTGR
ncbi:MAG: PQQ-binding-like beta-propeller repeat protein [Armatimonadota bacterium]|nr:PQQ-binding-like beta-propeller repeat protein [Armatimonadota bacterium]